MLIECLAELHEIAFSKGHRKKQILKIIEKRIQVILQDDHRMPEEAGIGFVDVGCGIPGTHLHKFSSEIMQGWGSGFFIRLTAHLQRANQHLG